LIGDLLLPGGLVGRLVGRLHHVGLLLHGGPIHQVGDLFLSGGLVLCLLEISSTNAIQAYSFE
jgi:hypothetical protein